MPCTSLVSKRTLLDAPPLGQRVRCARGGPRRALRGSPPALHLPLSKALQGRIRHSLWGAEHLIASKRWLCALARRSWHAAAGTHPAQQGAQCRSAHPSFLQLTWAGGGGACLWWQHASGTAACALCPLAALASLQVRQRGSHRVAPRSLPAAEPHEKSCSFAGPLHGGRRVGKLSPLAWRLKQASLSKGKKCAPPLVTSRLSC